jgi:uncharacterized circularly permuted ATP-grasp superfamily protein/uncharacterized alpha-E superfamily protein
MTPIPNKESFCQVYSPRVGCYDELYDSDGKPREHWEYFIRSLQSLGRLELESRRKEAGRLLRENGVTYNVYGDPQGRNRPWELDPIPLLISSEEWAEIESGLIQRAELLNMVLADLYGPRELIRKGLLPLELIYAHAGFLRPCDQVLLPGPHSLIVYAADLARSADGQMWVIGDRTQAPSGAGYALENRVVMTRILPSLFRDSHVHRLALFFRALRTTLASVAPQQREDPRIVVLTPGSRTETYFEHAYLAGYLGYTLVQSADLTIRDGAVWLRSLDGLQAVDVILRRVDDHFCDPLELRPDSRLGVAGLLQAARRGQVAIANPLGSSVLENPGLMAFLPKLARHLLGQDLRLPSAATWWCGQPKECNHVLAKIDQLVIKPIYRHHNSSSLFGPKLSSEQREYWRARIRAQPYLFVGQEIVGSSSTPALVEGSLQPRQAVLRAFLTAREDDYVVMPGGLTRIAPAADTRVISNQAGSVSKDTWVLASEPEKQISLWLQPRYGMMMSRGGYIPSHTAENLFWVGRYAERAEQCIRLIRNVFLRLHSYLEWEEEAHRESLYGLLRALTYVTDTYPGFTGEGLEERLRQPEAELLAVIVDESRVGTLSSNLRSLVNATYAVRGLLSVDTWRIIHDIEGELEALHRGASKDLPSAQDELDQLITALVAFAGLTTENITRGQGWHFLDMGRRLERGGLLISIMRATLVPVNSPPVEDMLLESALATADSLITYRRRYRSHLQMDTALDLLLLDETNPRSLRYQLDRLQEHIDSLPRERVSHELSQEERLLLEASSQLRLIDTAALSQVKPGAALRADLDQLLTRISHPLYSLSDVLTETYFSHTQGPQQLVPTRLNYEL